MNKDAKFKISKKEILDGRRSKLLLVKCGYTRWNHNEPLVGQITLFESGAQFNPTQGFRAFKKLKLAIK